MSDPKSKYDEVQPLGYPSRCDRCGGFGPWEAMSFSMLWCELCDSEEARECPNCGPFRNYREATNES